MSDWSPEQYHSDPTVNALLNIAASLSKCGDDVRHLIYGMKYGDQDGMSIAEALEVAAEKAAGTIAEAITGAFGEEHSHWVKPSLEKSAE